MEGGSQGPKFRRPAAVGQYAAQVAEWLRQEPTLSAADILRRARRAGYRGGKSALYELVRRVRTWPPDDQPGRTLQTLQIIVVARDREHLGNFLKRAFEGNATVQVVFDRRRVQDRRLRAAPHESEQRQRNRRAAQQIDGLLRTIGWTIVQVRPSRNRRSSGA
jgi:hypothetical protein